MELPTVNQQPVEKADYREDGSLEVHSVWHSIQGEGPHAGRPAIFLRLAGCNLDCPACDTDYTSYRFRDDVTTIVKKLDTLAIQSNSNTKLVVITGGEPFRQNIYPLVLALLNRDYEVQIETNGTLCPDPTAFKTIIRDKNFTAVVSPKTPKIHEVIAVWATAYKYILHADRVDPADGLPLTSLNSPGKPARPHPAFMGEVYLQPEDTKEYLYNTSGKVVGEIEGQNDANLQACVKSCLRFNHRLSLQVHKIAGLS